MKNSFSGFSYKEKIVSYYVGKYFFIWENYHPEWLEGKELDIYIPSIKIALIWITKKMSERAWSRRLGAGL